MELTRNFVDRFNHRFGKTLVKPEIITPKEGGRIMSLQDPTSKMSKSDSNPKGFISLLDDPKTIIKKVKSAVTDSLGRVQYDKENQPAISNLLIIYSNLAHEPIEDIIAKYDGLGYGQFKKDLADLIVSVIEPIQRDYYDLMEGSELDDILKAGGQAAGDIARETLARLEEAIGLTY